MSNSLPQSIIPARLSEQQASLSGHLRLADMPRLLFSLHEVHAEEAEVELNFTQDTENFIVIYGKIRARLPLLCQRCFKAMVYPVDAQVIWSPVKSETQADELPAQYEPCLMQADSLNILDVVEEELLLSLPLVPMHNEAECSVKLPNEKQDADPIKSHLFEVLKKYTSRDYKL